MFKTDIRLFHFQNIVKSIQITVFAMVQEPRTRRWCYWSLRCLPASVSRTVAPFHVQHQRLYLTKCDEAWYTIATIRTLPSLYMRLPLQATVQNCICAFAGIAFASICGLRSSGVHATGTVIYLTECALTSFFFWFLCFLERVLQECALANWMQTRSNNDNKIKRGSTESTQVSCSKQPVARTEVCVCLCFNDAGGTAHATSLTGTI